MTPRRALIVGRLLGGAATLAFAQVPAAPQTHRWGQRAGLM